MWSSTARSCTSTTCTWAPRTWSAATRDGKLVGSDILASVDLQGPRILLGDFNEWLRGLTTRLLTEHFGSDDIRVHLGRKHTYPGPLPLLHLDHVYFDEGLHLEGAMLHRSRKAIIASDHLPIAADFRMRQRENLSLIPRGA